MTQARLSFTKKLDTFITRLESYRITPAAYALVFLCLSFIRNFLEGAAGPARSAGTNHETAAALLQMAALFNLEWITLLLALALAISASSGTKIISVLKILLLSYSVIITVPFLDLLLYFPNGCKIDYLYTLHDYGRALLFFFWPFTDAGVCAGIRLEVFISFILCGAYIYLKTKSPLRAAAGAGVLYFLAVSSMAYPVFILLPFLPLKAAAFDSFVHGFFYTDAYSASLLNRVSVMIFLLLVPLLFTVYAAHNGIKASLGLIKKAFSAAALFAVACLVAGYALAAKNTGLGFFRQPADVFFLCAAVLIVLLVFLCKTCFEEKEKTLTRLLPLLAAVSSLAVSFSFLLICVFVLCLLALLYMEPFLLYKKAFAKYVFFAVSACVFAYAGGSLVTGPEVFSKISPVLPLLIIFAAFFTAWAGSTEKNKTAHAGLFISCLAFPAALASPLLFTPAAVTAVVSAFAVYMAKNKTLKEAIIYLSVAILVILSVFFQ